MRVLGFHRAGGEDAALDVGEVRVGAVALARVVPVGGIAVGEDDDRVVVRRGLGHGVQPLIPVRARAERPVRVQVLERGRSRRRRHGHRVGVVNRYGDRTEFEPLPDPVCSDVLVNHPSGAPSSGWPTCRTLPSLAPPAPVSGISNEHSPSGGAVGSWVAGGWRVSTGWGWWGQRRLSGRVLPIEDTDRQGSLGAPSDSLQGVVRSLLGEGRGEFCRLVARAPVPYRQLAYSYMSDMTRLSEFGRSSV